MKTIAKLFNHDHDVKLRGTRLVIGSNDVPSRTALAPRVPMSHLQNSSVGIQNTARRRPFISAGFVEALLV